MVMGADFWKYFSERRMTLSNGKYVEIGEFMALVRAFKDVYIIMLFINDYI